MKDLPFEKEAEELGYSLWSYTADRAQASYFKPYIHLTLNENGTGELTAFLRAVKLSVGPFSFPNKNFQTFEQQMLRILWLTENGELV